MNGATNGAHDIRPVRQNQNQQNRCLCLLEAGSICPVWDREGGQPAR